MKTQRQFAAVPPSQNPVPTCVRYRRGFSMIELLIVISIGFIVAGIGTMTLQPIMRSIQVSNAVNTTLGTLRYARQLAIAKRNVYMVTLSNAAIPNTISITDTDPVNPHVVETVTLPNSVSFDNEPGIPNTAATTPDGFGSGAAAIDFAQKPATGAANIIYFYPDGSARDIASNINNGVVYIARPGNLISSHAISLWGTTGRLRGWFLTTNGTVQWNQQ